MISVHNVMSEPSNRIRAFSKRCLPSENVTTPLGFAKALPQKSGVLKAFFFQKTVTNSCQKALRENLGVFKAVDVFERTLGSLQAMSNSGISNAVLFPGRTKSSEFA